MSTAHNRVSVEPILGSMLVIRRFEEAVFRLFAERAFTGHYHLYIGQEATAAGAMRALQDGDIIFTTHRNHGHLLARGADPRRAFAEILGRRDGLLGGRGGTFHLAAPALGIPHTSALVGGCTALAIGAAHSLRSRKLDRIAAVFFGDGALEEGVAYEALNIASLWRLPVLFLCENNAPDEQGRKSGANPGSLAAQNITDIPRALGIESHRIDGADPDAVFQTVSTARELCLAERGPVFIECVTPSWPGNAGQWPEMVTGITRIESAWEPVRQNERWRSWYETGDPILRYCRQCCNDGTLSRGQARELDSRIRREIDAAAAAALTSAPAEPDSALHHVFA